MKTENKATTWDSFKTQLENCKISLFSIFHYIVLIALWITVAFFIFDEEYSHAVAVAVIIVAWKMKSRMES